MITPSWQTRWCRAWSCCCYCCGGRRYGGRNCRGGGGRYGDCCCCSGCGSDCGCWCRIRWYCCIALINDRSRRLLFFFTFWKSLNIVISFEKYMFLNKCLLNLTCCTIFFDSFCEIHFLLKIAITYIVKVGCVFVQGRKAVTALVGWIKIQALIYFRCQRFCRIETEENF